LTLLAALPTHAAELAIDVRNRAHVTLECHAVAGHWYGFDFGTIPAGATTRIVFGLDRGSGTVSLPNSLNQRLPIQYVYCGRAGDAWHTRADLPLRRLADGARPAIITCRDSGAGVACE
jgi:hypothetical protein